MGNLSHNSCHCKTSKHWHRENVIKALGGEKNTDHNQINENWSVIRPLNRE